MDLLQTLISYLKKKNADLLFGRILAAIEFIETPNFYSNPVF